MFCEKCGNKANEGEKFCEKCGAPLNPSPEQVETPVNEQPVAQVQTEAQTVAQPEAVKAPKKPMSKKTKKIILFSSIGAAFVAVVLTVLFVFIIPMMNKIDPSQFIEFKINDEILFDGYLSADVSVDSERIYIEKLGGTKIDSKNSSEMLQSMLSGKSDSSIKSAAGISSILESCDISASVKGAEDDSKDNNDDDSYYSTRASLSNLKSDDTVVVKLTWDKSDMAKANIKNIEKSIGVGFDTSDKTIEFKVADKIEEQGIKTRTPIDFDFFKYADENGIFYSKGVSDGNISFCIKDFSFEQGGCTFSYNSEDGFRVTGGTDDERKLFINLSQRSYLDDGATVEVKINTTNNNDNLPEGYVPGTDVFFTEISKEYTAKANTPMTVDEAKSNLEAIKTNITTALNETRWDNKDVDIKEVYYLAPKADTNKVKNRILVIYQDKIDDNEYGIQYYDNCYMLNDEYFYEYTDDEFLWSGDKKSLKDVQENSYHLKDSQFTATKLS